MGARLKIFIDAKPEQVLHVMTDPDLSKAWLKDAVETIPLSGSMDRPGARFCITLLSSEAAHSPVHSLVFSSDGCPR